MSSVRYDSLTDQISIIDVIQMLLCHRDQRSTRRYVRRSLQQLMQVQRIRFIGSKGGTPSRVILFDQAIEFCETFRNKSLTQEHRHRVIQELHHVKSKQKVSMPIVLLVL